MNDFEKDENGFSEEPIQNNEQESLNEELEEIRSRFQEILDERTATYLAGGDIQGYDEEEPSSEEQPSDSEDKCSCCGENKRAVQYGEDYPYCEDCRNLMQHQPFSFSGIVALICVLFLTGVGVFYNFSKNADIIDKSLNAESYLAEGKIYSAAREYSSILQNYAAASSEFGSVKVPKKIVKKYALLCDSLSEYAAAAGVSNQFLSEKDLKNPAYKKLADYSEKNAFLEKISTVINEAIKSGITDTDKMLEIIEALRNEEGSDDFLIDNYRLTVLQYFGAGLDEQYDLLTEMKEKYPDRWIISYVLCDVCSKLGKTEEAQECFDVVIKHNTEDASIFVYLADAYRFSQEPDPDRMLEIIEEGIAADSETQYMTTDLAREKAVALMLKGDYTTAFEVMSEAYTEFNAALQYGQAMNPMQFLYTYQLCAYMSENQDAYDVAAMFIKNLESYGYSASKDIAKLIKGKTDVKTILTDKEGDLA